MLRILWIIQVGPKYSHIMYPYKRETEGYLTPERRKDHVKADEHDVAIGQRNQNPSEAGRGLEWMIS